MADDRINSGRNEFDNQPEKETNTEGNSGIGLISGQLSRSQRHGGSTSQTIANTASTGKTGAKQAVSKKENTEWEDDDEEQHRFPTWVRVMFWILRKSIVPIIMLIMLVIGLYIGFVVVGKGPKDEVFDWATWRHLYDLVFAES
ncbi:DNA-directed RNA polymerase subunit beta [Paenibacillus sp. GSMTC-2017]|uniref:DNA-directed RNA polymerase subunit beta n=1 Tax=Paenibacillus sp. GSMTC-2017 TaxID=2794350 RepID=UPI001A186D6B|nr:DNA-directed RNA polymerase subunit beta [Paenibacillus sp. GSMTC-2017]MBH5320591.1 DNA-directed RNA polymerase subunit beta [Paenibacillus sp. GSMTC-2017]